MYSLDELKQLHGKEMSAQGIGAYPVDAPILLVPLCRDILCIPMLGVCLGHQAIGQVYDGHVVRASEPMHWKTSLMYHQEQGVFRHLPVPLEADRYHSLIVERSTLPTELEITAEMADGLIMGLRHRACPVEGVQFHPESIMTPVGKDLLSNFLTRIPVPLHRERSFS
jgi:anthranilate synthase/aminodeoxychorismate synthase-like glutamine amidotransferase